MDKIRLKTDFIKARAQLVRLTQILETGHLSAPAHLTEYTQMADKIVDMVLRAKFLAKQWVKG